MAALLNSLVVNTKNRHLVWKLRTKLDSVIKTASIIREQAIYRKPNVFSLVSRLQYTILDPCNCFVEWNCGLVEGIAEVPQQRDVQRTAL